MYNMTGLGAVAQPTFSDAISAARSALFDLRTRATALRLAATDTGTRGLAEEALKFATDSSVPGDAAVGRGWRILRFAQQRQDAVKLKTLQKVVKNITSALRGELVTPAIQRFLLFTIPIVGPALALTPAEVSEAVKEELKTTDLPNSFKDPPLPLWAKVGLGFGAIFIVGYTVRAFK